MFRFYAGQLSGIFILCKDFILLKRYYEHIIIKDKAEIKCEYKLNRNAFKTAQVTEIKEPPFYKVVLCHTLTISNIEILDYL